MVICDVSKFFFKLFIGCMCSKDPGFNGYSKIVFVICSLVNYRLLKKLYRKLLFMERFVVSIGKN